MQWHYLDKETLKIILGKDLEGTGIRSIFHGQSTLVRWRRRPLDSEFQRKPHFVDQTVPQCQQNGFEEPVSRGRTNDNNYIFEKYLGDKTHRLSRSASSR